EGEGREMAVRAERAALVLGAEGFTSVLDERKSMSLGQLPQRIELARIAEDVDSEDRAGAVSDGGLRRSRVEVQRTRVDVREHGPRALVEEAVGRGDEGERRRHNLVSGADSGQSDGEVKPRGAARDARRVSRADALCKELLEAVERRAERERTRAQHLEHELLLALAEVRRGEADLP